MFLLFSTYVKIPSSLWIYFFLIDIQQDFAREDKEKSYELKINPCIFDSENLRRSRSSDSIPPQASLICPVDPFLSKPLWVPVTLEI